MVEHNVECDFCGHVKQHVACTSRGNLCYDCLKIYQVELKNGIRQIDGEQRKIRSPKIEDKSASEKSANEALWKMAGGQFDVTGKKISVG